MRFFKNRDKGAMFLILEGIAFTMVVNLYNPFIQMFAKRMGAGNFYIALLSAAPPLVAIFVLIPFGILIERINRKKRTVLVLLFINSLFYAAITFVPVIPHQAKVLAYVILIGLMNCPGSLYLTTWQSYFADNFKGSYANRVYSIRSKYSTFFGLVTVLVTGLLLTTVPKSDGERLFLYQVFYGVCFVLTLVQLFFFSRVNGQQEHPEVQPGSDSGSAVSDTVQSQSGELPHKAAYDKAAAIAELCTPVKPSRVFGKANFAEMLSNKPFLIFCLCGFVFHLSWQMGWPLFFIYNANYAGLNEFQFSLVSLSAGFTQFLSYSMWNKMIDKKGSSLAIVLGAAGLALNPLFFITLQSFTVIVLVNIYSGIVGAGFSLALFCGLLETLPSEKKTVYISVFNTLTNITGFIAPFIGIWIYNQTNIFWAMGLVCLFRLIAVLFYIIRWWSSRRGEIGGHTVQDQISM